LKRFWLSILAFFPLGLQILGSRVVDPKWICGFDGEKTLQRLQDWRYTYVEKKKIKLSPKIYLGQDLDPDVSKVGSGQKLSGSATLILIEEK
jgi:hypothetical protein